jgi:predicted Rossmann fold nucleotide-binding protein DprA/Smf involved in DNA uptake
MDKAEGLHALMLSELPQVGDKIAARILERSRARGHGLATFLRLPEAVLRDDYELHPATVACLGAAREEHERRCQWLLDRLTAAGGQVWMIDNPAYPPRVHDRMPLPPSVLYATGATAVLTSPTLAVLNSRTLSDYSVTACMAVVQAAAAQGFTLVGGGMKTAYRITAVASRAVTAPRLIVLDRGLFATLGARFDRDPFGFGPGRGRLDAARTLVLSPFRLMDHASPHNGRRRDELIAALGDVIVAVHARPGGEMERVCLRALDRGQSVLSWYGENAGLVAAGATPIEEADLTAGLVRYLPR